MGHLDKISKSLKIYNQWYQQLLHNLGIGLVLIDMNQVISYANDEMARILGLSKEGIVGKNFLDFHKETTRENALQYFRILTSSEYSEPLSIQVPYQDKTLNVTISKLFEEGVFQGLIVAMTDCAYVNETSDLRATLAANQAQNLLTQIDSFQTGLDIGKEILLTDSPESASLFLNKLYDSLKDLENTAVDIARLTKEMSASPKISWELIDVKAIIDNLVTELAPIAERKSVTIETFLPIDLPCPFGDVKMTTMVFFNLIRNAIRFSEENQIVSINAVTKKHNVEITFSHGGKGLDSSQIESLFRKRFKVAQVHYGKSLSLSIMKDLLETHNGNIDVQSDKNSTRFIVSLPFDEDKFIVTEDEESAMSSDIILPNCLAIEEDAELRRTLQNIGSELSNPVLCISSLDELETQSSVNKEAYCYYNILSPKINITDLFNVLSKSENRSVWITSFLNRGIDNKTDFGLGIQDYILPRENGDWIKQIETYMINQEMENKDKTIMYLGSEDNKLEALKAMAADLSIEFISFSQLRHAVLQVFEHPPNLILLEYNYAWQKRFEMVYLFKTGRSTSSIPILMLLPEIAVSNTDYWFCSSVDSSSFPGEYPLFSQFVQTIIKETDDE